MPDYPLYLQAAKISRREAITELKKQFPTFENPALAMVCNPENYGVQLTPGAEKRLVSAFGWYAGLATRPKKKDTGRRKANRLYVRLDDAMFDRLKQLFARTAYSSMQDLIEAALADFINRHGGAD